MKKLNVLGTKYSIEYLDEQDETMRTNGWEGYCDFEDKIIKVLKSDFITNIITRHEILHAFLYESGIVSGTYFHTEECIDFFATQLPKITKLMKEGKCDD